MAFFKKEVCKLVSQVSSICNRLKDSVSVWNFMLSQRFHKFHFHSTFLRKRQNAEFWGRKLWVTLNKTMSYTTELIVLLSGLIRWTLWILVKAPKVHRETQWINYLHSGETCVSSFEAFFYGWTKVPMFSPLITFFKLPTVSMSNTIIGSLFSLHMQVAVKSITLRPRLRTSS